MVGKKGNTKMSEITKTTTEKNGNQKNGQQKIGQPENSATKNDSVGKRATQSYIVSRRDANSSLGIRKNGNRKVGIYIDRPIGYSVTLFWQSENGHLFTSCCHTDDAAAGLCYTGSPENHRYTDRVTVMTTDWISLTRTVTELYLLFV